MYDRFYGFSERPFSLLPDPDFLFLGDKHRAALDALELAIFNHSGFCVISGAIGAGKTTLIRELLNRLDDDVQVGLVSNTHPSFGELMQWVMAAYGLPCDTDDRLDLHKRFIDYAIQRYADGKHTLLIIDEAQNLSMAALEELRMLSNVNSGKDLILQIIMVGQSELREKLRRPELAQFAQRISVDYYLGGMTVEETCLYIQHRVVHAGGAVDLFTSDACRRVHAFSQGIPRVINRLCDLSLVYGFAAQREQIGADLVEAVAQEQRLGETMEAARQRSTPAWRPESNDIHPELQVKAGHSDDAGNESDSPPAAGATIDLHTLVVNAEQSSRARGARGVRWLFVGVAVMVGVTAWMSRGVWLPTIQDAVVEVQDATDIAGDDEAARRVMQRAAEKAKLEQERLEKAKREEETRLAKQRAAEKAKLEQARLEKAKREAEVRLARRRAAEKVKLEQAKREQAERERNGAETRRVQAQEAVAAKTNKTPTPANWPSQLTIWANTPEWSEEDDEELLIETPVAEPPPATIDPPETSTAAATVATGKDSAENASEPDGFTTNP